MIETFRYFIIKVPGHQIIKTSGFQVIKSHSLHCIKYSIHQSIKPIYLKKSISMTDKKSITIKIRVDSQTHAEIQSRADRYTDGNLSAFVRCATLKYEEQPITDHDNPRMFALIKSAIKAHRTDRYQHKSGCKAHQRTAENESLLVAGGRSSSLRSVLRGYR